MKKHIAICAGFAVLNICLVKKAFAQHFIASDQDYRIAKFEKDIAQYLFPPKDSDGGKPFNIEDYKNSVMVTKCLEIYPDSLLLVSFMQGDDAPTIWGVLGNNEKYFFHDPDNLNEPGVALLRKRYSDTVLAPIVSFCYHWGLYDGLILTRKATAVYRENLTVVRDFLHTTDNLDIKKLDSAVSFLEKLTGIKRISNPLKYHLTTQDYTNWLAWLSKNYSTLYWDPKTNIVSVKKGVSLSIIKPN